MKFSFNDDLIIFFDKITYSQPLGCWHPEIDKPKMPHYTKFHEADGTTICLQNIDFQELKITINKFLPNSCIDYFIYSEIKIIKDEFIQESIVIL